MNLASLDENTTPLIAPPVEIKYSKVSILIYRTLLSISLIVFTIFNIISLINYNTILTNQKFIRHHLNKTINNDINSSSNYNINASLTEINNELVNIQYSFDYFKELFNLSKALCMQTQYKQYCELVPTPP